MYTDSYKFDNGGAGLIYKTFTGNDVYDPDYTGTGHQPTYYDQLSAIYAKVKVLSSQITVTVKNTQANLGWFAIYPTRSNSPLSDANGIKQVQYGRWKSMTGNAAIGKLTVRNRMTTKKMWGIKSIMYADDFDHTVGGAGPLNEWFWILVGGPDDGLGFSAYTDIRITYICQFYNRITTTIS